MKRSWLFRIVFVALLAGIYCSCAILQDITQTVQNLSHCSFKLQSISNLTLAGIPVTGKSSFSLVDGARLVQSFSSQQLPVTFTLNVAAQNTGSSSGQQSSSASLTAFPWTLLVDSVETISGNISSPVSIPGGGGQAMIPCAVSLDLYQFFHERGYNHILNLALALGGSSSSPSRLTLKARPTVRTSLGSFTAPRDVTIVDKEFRGE
jgi:hypothetical protein